MNLDVRTLSFVAAINAFILFLWLLSIFTGRKKYPGANEWIVSALFLFAAMAAISFRGILHDALTVVLGNTCFIASFVLVDFGLRRFADDRPAFILYIAATSLIAVSFIYFTFFEPQVAIRIAIISCSISAFCVRLAWYTHSRIRRIVMGRTTLLVTVFALLGLWDLTRAVLTLLYEPAINDFMKSGLIQSTTVLTFNAASILIYAGLVTVHAQRLENELKTLEGFLPICASCKKIRDDRGYWKQVEEYIEHHTDATMTHTICPNCAHKLYPDLGTDKPTEQ